MKAENANFINLSTEP